MTVSDLQLLVDYHYWARDRILDAVSALTPEQYSRDLGSSFRSIRDTLVHLYSAEWAWQQRWQGTSPTAMQTPDQFPDVNSLRKAWAANEVKVRALVDGLDEAGVNRVYEYKMLSGTPGSSVFWQMIQHVANHGSYHRGQVTTMLRQLGAAPGKGMDMIVYHRDKAAAQGSPQ
jgi:uncharacterized damage-inducible protein DinB